MTLAEIEDQLPNGLHDAKLKSFAVDLAGSTLTLVVDVDRSSPDAEGASLDPTQVRITVTGLCYFKIDPPDLVHGYDAGRSSSISAGDDPLERGLVSPEVVAKLPKGSFLHWIFLVGWNSILVISGMNAEIEWAGQN